MQTDRPAGSTPRSFGMPAWVVNLGIVLLLAALWPLSRTLDQYMDGYYLDILVRIGIAITLAVSLNLINGITGQFSLGHAGFMALGAYTCGVLLKHYAPTAWSPVLLFLVFTILGGLVAAVAGVLIGIPTLRLRGDYLAIATLGFGQIITVVLNQIESIGPFEVGGSAGLHNIPLVTNFFWAYFWAVICVVAVARLAYSGKGKPFFAVREDEIAAAAMGIDTTFYKIAAFVVGAFFAGVAGGLSATFEANISPDTFNFIKSILIVMMVVLGGSGSITGSILGAIFLTALPEVLRITEGSRMVVYALVLIITMLLRPEGLLGNRELWWTRKRPRPSTNAVA